MKCVRYSQLYTTFIVSASAQAQKKKQTFSIQDFFGTCWVRDIRDLQGLKNGETGESPK